MTRRAARASRIEVALRRLALLPIHVESHRDSYRRSEFGSGWRNTEAEGADARAETLIAWHRPGRAGVELQKVGDRVVYGRWRCRFSGDWITIASDLDIDHLVPLAEAWESGAWEWDRDRRVRYANGVGIRTWRRGWLLPVTASLNRAKGARDPAEWLPPNERYRANYAADWIAAKTYWGMSVDSAEKAALLEELRA